MRDPRTQLLAVKRVYFSIVRPQNGISLRIIRNALILHYRSRVQHGTPAAFSTTFLGSLTDDPGNDRCSMFPRLRLRIFPYFPSRCGPKSNIREKCRNTSGIHNVSRQKRRINSPINPVYVYIHSTSITDPLLANKTSSRSAVLFPPPSLPAETPPFPSPPGGIEAHVCTCPALHVPQMQDTQEVGVNNQKAELIYTASKHTVICGKKKRDQDWT